jgi:hypothetical protein
MRTFKKTMRSFIGISLLLIAGFSACKKDKKIEPEPDVIAGTGTVQVSLNHRAGNQNFLFNQNYITENGDTVNFDMLNYFISNFSLVNKDGSVFTIPKDDCYFLIKHENGKLRITNLNNIPSGDYTAIRFIVGVDSAKSCAPAADRKGDLDPVGAAQGMYWDWNSGYIFMMAEGLSPQSASGVFKLHVGGFGGYNTPTINNLRSFELSFPYEELKVREGKSSEVHVNVDVMELFKNPNTIKLAETPIIMHSAAATRIADNYKNMFVVDHVHNE